MTEIVEAGTTLIKYDPVCFNAQPCLTQLTEVVLVQNYAGGDDDDEDVEMGEASDEENEDDDFGDEYEIRHL